MMKKSLLALMLMATTLTLPQAFAQDTDGDGVFDNADLDNDNDGIVDALEGCQQIPGVVDSTHGPTAGTGAKKDQVLFFNWEGNTMKVGQKTSIVASNGVTYTAEITRVNSVSGPLPLPHEMKTWVSNPSSSLYPQQALAYLLYDNPGLKPAFYPNVSTTHDLDYDIKVSAVITGTTQTVPVDVIVVDAEATSPTPGGNPPKPPEVLTIKTDGGNFKIFDTYSYNPNNAPINPNPGGITTGVGTDTVVYKDTQSIPGGTTLFYSENASTITFKIKTKSRQGAALGVYLQCTKDTDGDGIPDRIDPDSDNDGCFDAIEGTADINAGQLNGGVIAGGVDSKGVPNSVSGGQDIGQSLTPAKVEFDTTAPNAGQPENVTITIGALGQNADFNSAANATVTNTYVAGNPDYTIPPATAGTVIYQWQQSTDNGATWTDIAGATGFTYTETNNNNGIDTTMNGYQYRVLISCAENSCQVESKPATLKVNQPMYNMVKTVSPTSVSAPGTLTYTFTFTNNGNVDLQNLTVADPDIDAGSLSCNGDADSDGDIDNLAVDASETCTATRTVTQADINNGANLVNTAVPSAEDGSGKPATEDNDGDPSTQNDDSDNTATTTVTQTPALALVKTAAVNDVNGNGFIDAGDTIAYSFRVSNTGNVELTFTGVTDPKLPGLSCTLTPPALAVGDSNVALTCTNNVYTIMAADMTAGQVTNSATGTASDPKGNPVTDTSGTANDNDTPTVVGTPAVPRLALVKTAAVNDVNGNGFTDAGDTITYSFTVSNTGNVELTFTGVTDPKLPGLSCTLTPPALAVNASNVPLVCTGNVYTITAADVAAGQVTNSATGTASDPNGNPVTDTSGTANDNDTPTVVPFTATPRLALVKTAAVNDVNSNGFSDVGDTITYSFAVSNTGNVALTFTGVTDPKLPGLSCALTPATLAVGATDMALTCTDNVYTITAADVAAGQVDNSAVGNANDPNGNPVSDTSGTAPSNDVRTVVALSVAPVNAVNDTRTGTPGNPVVVSVLDNDSPVMIPGSVRIVDAGGNPVTALTVPGEGEWTVNTTSGEITFTPLPGFTGNPTPTLGFVLMGMLMAVLGRRRLRILDY